MKPDYSKSEDFYSGVLANIDKEKCIKCGLVFTNPKPEEKELSKY
jgi:hypothetical protein